MSWWLYLLISWSHDIFILTKDCEFRAGLTQLCEVAGLPLWEQSAYLAQQDLYTSEVCQTRYLAPLEWPREKCQSVEKVKGHMTFSYSVRAPLFWKWQSFSRTVLPWTPTFRVTVRCQWHPKSGSRRVKCRGVRTAVCQDCRIMTRVLYGFPSHGNTRPTQ